MDQKKEIEKDKKDACFTRRDFIKTAGIAAMSVSAGGCASMSKKQFKNAETESPVTHVSSTKSISGRDFDVVVIGTGMGGSAAGAISSVHGLKTLVLEKNPRPGGSCSWYEKEGFHVDTGAHMFIRGNKGPFGDVTERLGMGTPIEFVKAKNTLEVRGLNFNVVLSKNLFLKGLKMPKIAMQAQVNPLHYPSIATLMARIVLMSDSEIEALDYTSIEDFMARCTGNEQVRSMIAGLLGLMLIVPADKASAGESIWNLQKLLLENNLGYPKGGSATIPKTFLKGAEMHGAEVRMNAGVKKIEISNNKVQSVILESGERITTCAVISTTSVKDSVLRLVGEEHFPDSYVKKVKDLYPAFSAVQAKIALKKKVVKAGCLCGGLPYKCSNRVIGRFTKVAFENASNGVQGDYIPIYAPVPTSFDPELAPPGCQLITAVALAPPLNVDYVDDQQSWIDGMMRTLHTIIPEMDENLIFCDTWSVNTLASWIGKSDGSAITTGQTKDQVRRNRPQHQTDINGLYFAGDGAGMARGVGTELACQSGIDCADIVAGDFKAISV